MIPLSVPHIKGNEWKYVKECLDTEWVSTAGKYVNTFEEDIRKFTNAKYSVACVNGTSALHVALRIVGVARDDEVLVPTLTFIAPINVVHYLGAHPVFMDCDRYFNIDVEKTLRFIREETIVRDGFTYNKKTDRRISAIIPVHVFGNAVRLEEIVPICRERNIKIVEDATESLGTKYTQGHYVGKHTGTVGDIGCFSFNGNKIITTGGGGMIVTDNGEYSRQARYLTTQAKDDELRYVHHEVGYNFRLTNIQAALGVAQMEQLPSYLKTKRSNYELYKKEIDNIPGLHLAEVPEYANNNYWMYPLLIDKQVYKMDREEIMAYLEQNNIQTRPLWYLNHLQRPYQSCQHYHIEQASVLFERTLNIPCSVNLTHHDVQEVIAKLRHD